MQRLLDAGEAHAVYWREDAAKKCEDNFLRVGAEQCAACMHFCNPDMHFCNPDISTA